jgi:hypothetical protein
LLKRFQLSLMKMLPIVELRGSPRVVERLILGEGMESISSDRVTLEGESTKVGIFGFATF